MEVACLRCFVAELLPIAEMEIGIGERLLSGLAVFRTEWLGGLPC